MSRGAFFPVDGGGGGGDGGGQANIYTGPDRAWTFTEDDHAPDSPPYGDALVHFMGYWTPTESGSINVGPPGDNDSHVILWDFATDLWKVTGPDSAHEDPSYAWNWSNYFAGGWWASDGSGGYIPKTQAGAVVAGQMYAIVAASYNTDSVGHTIDLNPLYTSLALRGGIADPPMPEPVPIYNWLSVPGVDGSGWSLVDPTGGLKNQVDNLNTTIQQIAAQVAAANQTVSGNVSNLTTTVANMQGDIYSERLLWESYAFTNQVNVNNGVPDPSEIGLIFFPFISGDTESSRWALRTGGASISGNALYSVSVLCVATSEPTPGELVIEGGLSAGAVEFHQNGSEWLGRYSDLVYVNADDAVSDRYVAIRFTGTPVDNAVPYLSRMHFEILVVAR
jgi:hypothetical protein